MKKKLEVLHVDSGKICPTCPNCRFFKYLNAPKDVFKVTWRCPECGQKTPFEINWRKGRRKECREQIVVRGINAFMIDMSLGGISFETDKINVLKGAKLTIILPLDFIRKGKGKREIIEIEITSKSGNKYGAKFLSLTQGSEAQRNIYCWLLEE